jgi:hypothetical protein
LKTAILTAFSADPRKLGFPLMSRAVSIALAFLLALAGLISQQSSSGAPCGMPVSGAGDSTHSCCGELCLCGDGCMCAVKNAPSDLPGDIPAPQERPRCERMVLVAAPRASGSPCFLTTPAEFAVPTTACAILDAAPTGRQRLARVSRWNT